MDTPKTKRIWRYKQPADRGYKEFSQSARLEYPFGDLENNTIYAKGIDETQAQHLNLIHHFWLLGNQKFLFHCVFPFPRFAFKSKLNLHQILFLNWLLQKP